MKWRVIVAAALAALAGALLAALVAAHTVRYPSGVNMNAYTNGASNNYIYGGVTSAEYACAEVRRVDVFRKRPGRDRLYASPRSHASASPGSATYTVEAETGDLPEGVYYAHLRRKDLKPGDNHTHLCKGSRSDELGVGP